MKIKIVLLTALVLAVTSISFAQSKTVAPNVIVRNLYAAQKAGSGPFFQMKNRAVVDKYFTRELADLIWKDAVAAKGEVGALEFDPLYGSQDPQITKFVIMETGWGGDSKFGKDDEAVVQVTFKNLGREEMVSFQFRQGKNRAWKIFDIRYPSGEMLKNILSGKANTSQTVLGEPYSAQETYTGKGELQIGTTDSVILQVGEQTGDYAAFCFPNASEVGRAVLAKCKEGELCEFTGIVEFASGCKVPGLEATLSASGKLIKVDSIKLISGRPAITAKKGTIEYLAQTLSAAFEAGTMGSLDAGRPYLNSVEIVVEDTLSDGKTSKAFKTLKAGEQWFRRGRKEANFEGNVFQKCAKGVCTFEGGVVHNTLFLHKITYTVVKGRPFIKTIYFLDGN